MNFLISDTFTDSLARLIGDEQKTVKTTDFDIQMNPENLVMNFYNLSGLLPRHKRPVILAEMAPSNPNPTRRTGHSKRDGLHSKPAARLTSMLIPNPAFEEQ